jgi:hypothetical protein
MERKPAGQTVSCGRAAPGRSQERMKERLNMASLHLLGAICRGCEHRRRPVPRVMVCAATGDRVRGLAVSAKRPQDDGLRNRSSDGMLRRGYARRAKAVGDRCPA